MSCNTFILTKKNILNILSEHSGTPDKCIPYLTLYNIQIWVNIHKLTEKLEKKLETMGYYPRMYGIRNKKLYLIFSKDKNTNFIEVFLIFFNKKYIFNNLLILDKNILKILNRQIYLENEVSGNIEYNIIFVNEDKNWKYTYIKEEKYRNGEYDNVLIDYKKLTFHTHPVQSYSKKWVKTYAWPSLQDYITLYESGNYVKEIIYHLILTKEGIYLVIYNYQKNPGYNISSIRKDMDILYDTMSLDKFLETVNGFNSGFLTLYMKWDKDNMIFNY